MLAALVFGAYACSPKGDGSVSEVMVNGDKMYVFSLNELKSDTVTVSLSSLVDYCKLVQLETSDEAYFRPGSTTVTEKYIGVRSSGAPYKLFDHSGKFLGNVGAVGNGPGEWNISLYDDIIDDKNELIYLSSFTSDRILVYSTSGQFLRDIVAPGRLQKPKMFLSGDVLTVIHMPFQNDKAIAYQFDVKTGKVLKELGPPPAQFIVQSFDSELISTRNAPGVFDFLHTSSDTLYHFDVNNNKVVPAFRVAYVTSERVWMRYFPLNKNMFLTNVNVLSEEQRRFVPIGMVATDLKTKTSSWIKVVNDFYGNMPVSIGLVNNGYWVLNTAPEQLMESIENHLAQKGLSESDKQILNKTLSTLKEDANNVVFIGKLKDEVKMK
jgi:hypothetical protein